MKKEKPGGRNYLFFGGLFRLKYAYIDLNTDRDYVADSLFYKRNIHVRFIDEMVRDGDKYRIIFCKIQKKYKKAFEEALEEIRTKMSLLGHNDYDEYCDRLMAELEVN